ncbi:MAG: S1 RNA-binding domain-containing protein, partial [Candidatus Pacebacteria bacterium]|nr:S1 RNA-binding domain-containing protein [Candidatus Paceibacterota bacterium]
VMITEISQPRTDINSRAPKIIALTIKEDQIGLVIGPGGKMIKSIKEETGATEISIEDDGSVFITGNSGTAEAAAKMIEELTHEYVAGEKFDGEVTRIMDFGAFVRIGANTEGLVHISELAPFRINKVTDVLSEGERVPVIIKEIDDRKRINLSIKDVDSKFASNKGVGAPSSNTNHGTEQKSKPEENSKGE